MIAFVINLSWQVTAILELERKSHQLEMDLREQQSQSASIQGEIHCSQRFSATFKIMFLNHTKY